jgi:hypothetical protein
MVHNLDPRAARLLAEAVEDPNFTERAVALHDGGTMYTRKAGAGVVAFEIKDDTGRVTTHGGTHAEGSTRGAEYPSDWPFISELSSFHSVLEGKRSVFWVHDVPESTLYHRIRRELIQSGWSEDAAGRSESAFTTTSKFTRGANAVTLSRFAYLGQTVLTLME